MCEREKEGRKERQIVREIKKDILTATYLGHIAGSFGLSITYGGICVMVQ